MKYRCRNVERNINIDVGKLQSPMFYREGSPRDNPTDV